MAAGRRHCLNVVPRPGRKVRYAALHVSRRVLQLLAHPETGRLAGSLMDACPSRKRSFRPGAARPGGPGRAAGFPLRCGTHLLRATRPDTHKRLKLMTNDRMLYFLVKGLCDRIW